MAVDSRALHVSAHSFANDMSMGFERTVCQRMPCKLAMATATLQMTGLNKNVEATSLTFLG
jgi:hypothetical protein